MKKMIAIIGLVSFSLTALAGTVQQKEISINGKKAQALYVALGGNASAVKSGSDRIINVSDLECATQTETQQGDPSSAGENLTMLICSVTNSENESQDYLGVMASRLSLALKHAGAPQIGDSLNSSVSAKSVSCTKSTETQQGDPDAKPELLVMYSCDIQK